jgi:homoserine kinase
MLGLAFAQGRGDLLRAAMRDRIHQPYRAEICPLIPKLLPLAGTGEILGVALSGAGPAVLVIVGSESGIPSATNAILSAMEGHSQPELVISRFENFGALQSL